MKYKTIYGSNNDNFILKIKRVYNPIEKLHLKLAKWHLRKVLKLDKESIDKLYQKAYNSLMNNMLKNYTPCDAITSITAEQLIDKIEEINERGINNE